MEHFSASWNTGYCVSWILLGVLSCGKMSIKAGIKTRDHHTGVGARMRSALAIWHKSMSAFRKDLIMCTRAQTCCITVLRRKATSNIWSVLIKIVTVRRSWLTINFFSGYAQFRHRTITSTSVLQHWYHRRSIATGPAFSSPAFFHPCKLVPRFAVSRFQSSLFYLWL